MEPSNFDVAVVGGGAAGMTAAIGLARAGFSVCVIEAAIYPGAENWSGCVYFAENLAADDILGSAGVESLAWERRLIERGFFMTDGNSLLGAKYRDPDAFRNCYTVLRPIYDHHLAVLARGLGVVILSSTTAESLIRHQHRVIGVCTHRGPIYADLVFLAEGDASNLVTREGYERSTDERDTPKFLQGIKQVIEMPPGAIEEIFGVGAEEGVAYEMLLRNATFAGKAVHLNAGGFIYTNRQSLSVGLVLPADNLHEHFAGDPNLLAEWFENLPALEPWMRGGKRGVFGAKVIRGGGARDIPILIDEGLAIGGAASAIGIDFPYPNFTGPATAMGRLIARAACRIRDTGGRFTKSALEEHYLRPLQQTHYWQDVEFLRRWPAYVKRTQYFFDLNIDLALGSAHIWTQANCWTMTKWRSWLRFLSARAGADELPAIRGDLRHLARALRFREIAERPTMGRLLLDGAVNALRDIFGRPRSNLPAAGSLNLHYVPGPGFTPAGLPPPLLVRWFHRLNPVLAAAARLVYQNDTRPLSDKLPAVFRLLFRQINMLDLIGAGALTLMVGLSTVLLSVADAIRRPWRRSRKAQLPALIRHLDQCGAPFKDIAAASTSANQQWEARLAQLSYQTAKTSHIHVLWPHNLADKAEVAEQGLWHVCPAHVYEARTNSLGQAQVVVNFENCIKCETCWRTSSLVDWGRDGRQRFVYPVGSPVVDRLLATLKTSFGQWPMRAHAPRNDCAKLDRPLPSRHEPLAARLAQLEQKLGEFDQALAEEPRTLDKGRSEYLEMLARYAQQLASLLVEEIRDHRALERASGVDWAQIEELAAEMLAKSHEYSRRTWGQRYSWAASEGRQLRWHHVRLLRQALGVVGEDGSLATGQNIEWLRAERDAKSVAKALQEWVERLDRAFPSSAWRELERGQVLSSTQESVLRDLAAAIPSVTLPDLASSLHPPIRKVLLAELGRRDPALAYRVISHLWARDVLKLAGLEEYGQRLERGNAWACWAELDHRQAESWLVPAIGAQHIVLHMNGKLAVVDSATVGVKVESVIGLGLRCAGLARLTIDAGEAIDWRPLNEPFVGRAWEIISAADLIAVAYGMADQLCRRAIGHATSRVQFPGLFHDDQARDAIGKFGAIKKMVAEMAARRYVIETLDHVLTPTDLTDDTQIRMTLAKGLVAELLGTAPGSISYNAGQIFGGTGYSEDDILSKYYRDASAWRMLGVPNSLVWERHGQQLLRNWRIDGHRLSQVTGEIENFEDIAQRKALLTELDEVRNARSRLRGLLGNWISKHAPQVLPRAESEGHVGTNGAGKSEKPDPWFSRVATAAARQDARLLASKALLSRTHARLEDGQNAETEISLLRVWLQDSAVALDVFETMLQTGEPGHPAARPIVEIDADSVPELYADYLNNGGQPDTGDFLLSPLDLRRARFVPEMVETDPELRQRDGEFRTLLADYFGPMRDGLLYERYIERNHRPDSADLTFCRQHGFFAMPVPRELGGEGRRKIDYYLLTTNAQRIADVAISLSIQANTSIGTTPVLLARDKDLPQAIAEVDALISDANWLRQTATTLDTAAEHVERAGNPGRIVDEIAKRLADPRLSRGGARFPFAHFQRLWKQALVKTDDAAAWREAAGQWQSACVRLGDLRNELVLRMKACDLFLSWVACGHISAFALTEPAAGSDTARVGTRAVLRAVAVREESEGVYGFTPASGGEARTLLDAERLVFRERQPYYRWSDEASAAPIHFDAYDYETDCRSALRYFERNGHRIVFHDIAYIRVRDGQRWYDYWEMTGAKMWITNGRIAGIMALYAKTTEGVTGFMVDRHAEGLIVGKDEDKMGQNGSPTNELSLQAVRVPRENVLGLEGRGQVNALETLNVGRAGLAMSSVAQMRGLIQMSEAFAQARDGEISASVRWRLNHMRENQFIAEALVYEVIGRFEHPRTKSVRMESAISKMLASELLHEIIELAEEVHGLPGQTRAHLVEKRKRDARILNIYEGTNEIQRFFILKELASEIAPRWTQAATPRHAGAEAVEFEVLREMLRQRSLAAVDHFGQNLWQDPSLQADGFLLAEAIAWLKAAESTLGRLAWWGQVDNARATNPGPTQGLKWSDSEIKANLDCGRQSLGRCFGEVRRRLKRFDEEFTHLRRGYYGNEIRAAGLLFAGPLPCRLLERATVPDASLVHILVIVELLTPTSPAPSVRAGQLLEPYLGPSDADRAALEAALRLRDRRPERTTIEVVALGTPASVAALHEVASLDLSRVRMVVVDGSWAAADTFAEAVSFGRGKEKHDLVLIGAGNPGDQDGIIAHWTARRLDMEFAGEAGRIELTQSDVDGLVAVLEDADGSHQRAVPLPLFVAIRGSNEFREFSAAGFLRSLSRPPEIERVQHRRLDRHWQFMSARQSAPAVGFTATVMTPDQAARCALVEIGLGGTEIATAQFDGRIEEVAFPSLANEQTSILAIVTIGVDGRVSPGLPSVLQAAALIGNVVNQPVHVIVIAPRTAPLRSALGRIGRWHHGNVVIISGAPERDDAGLRSRFLANCWPWQAAIIIGEPWTEGTIDLIERRQRRNVTTIPRVRRLEAMPHDQLALEITRAVGRIRLRQILRPADCGPMWITVVGECEMAGSMKSAVGLNRVEIWSPKLDRFYGQADVQCLLADLNREIGTHRLSDSEFIIDVGYGIGNRDGYETVIEPLEAALRAVNVQGLMVGGSRKVTEELRLLGGDRQIGQSGVSVNPRVILAVGVSGAPQHMNYIGERAAVIAFNRDAEAPIMVWNQTQSRPRVFPVIGDLFQTVPAFTSAILRESAGNAESPGDIRRGRAEAPVAASVEPS